MTKLPIDAAGPVWSPTGTHIAFAAEVVPGKSPEETAKRDEEKAKAKSKVMAFDDLMIRHWDHYVDAKRSHVFVVEVATGSVQDLTKDLKVNTPPAPFGGSSDYTFSADGKSLVYTAEPLQDLAWSTNTDVWMVPVDGASAAVNLTAANPGADAQPAFSPNGTLAYLSQARAGFEADQWVLKTLDPRTGVITDQTSKLDRPVQSFRWHDDAHLVAVLDDRGSEPIVSLHSNGSSNQSGPIDKILRVAGGVNTSPDVFGTPHQADAGTVYLHGSINHPNEIYLKVFNQPTARVLTHHNDPLIAQLDLPATEGFSFPGADGDTVAGWLVKPPGFDPSKKYPRGLLDPRRPAGGLA